MDGKERYRRSDRRTSSAVRAAAAALVALSAALTGCGKSDTNQDADFYARRYYPIPERSALPSSGTQVILAGAHDTAKGDDRFGTGEVAGYFFVDLDSPELTHWNATAGEAAAPIATFGDRKQLLVFGDGTYRLALDTSAEMRETLDSSFHSEPSPDGQWYAYSPYDASSRPDTLYVQKFDGTEKRKILGPLPSKIYAVAWSPDGKHIALDCAEEVDFDSTGGKGDRINSLWTVDADGSHFERVYRDSEPNSTAYEFLQYMPDGKTIVFVFGNTVLSANLATRHVDTLFRAPAEGIIRGFARSPDGSSFALEQHGLYVYRVGGSSVKPVLVDPDVIVASFIWSPRGDRLVAKAHSAESDCIKGVDWKVNSAWKLCNDVLYVVDADGNNLRRLGDKYIAPELVGVYVH